ncbi:MAG TPA: hypothetical protein VN679_07670 [Candidatus Acidoferrales bacterium]|nr:hypothetical protein [Candidatus Acidoferrales bacterium]
MKPIVVLSVAALVAGCGPRPTLHTTSLQGTGGIDVEAVWNTQAKSCVDMLDKLDTDSLKSSKAKLALAVIGTLSGSVFSQLAKGSGKDAWSGLSGSTNALQSALDSSFSANLLLKEALYVAAVMVKTNQAFIAELNPQKQVQIANSLPILCRLARLQAIDEANQALSKGDDATQQKIKDLLLSTQPPKPASTPTPAGSIHAPATAASAAGP